MFLALYIVFLYIINIFEKHTKEKGEGKESVEEKKDILETPTLVRTESDASTKEQRQINIHIFFMEIF